MKRSVCENRLAPAAGQETSHVLSKNERFGRKKMRPVSLKTRLRLASAWKKIGSHAFRTGRQAAADRLLNGLAESKMPIGDGENDRVKDHEGRVFLKTGWPHPCADRIQAKKRGEGDSGCGQAIAYPQDRMCRTTFTDKTTHFFSTIGAGSIQSLSSSFSAT
jgi:hypothetical protein